MESNYLDAPDSVLKGHKCVGPHTDSDLKVSPTWSQTDC